MTVCVGWFELWPPPCRGGFHWRRRSKPHLQLIPVSLVTLCNAGILVQQQMEGRRAEVSDRDAENFDILA